MAIAKHKSRRSELRESRVLARRVQHGDRKAFQILYASYEGGLFRFGYRLTGDSEQAAALVDAAFSQGLATLPDHGLGSLDVGAHLFASARSLSYRRDGAARANGNGHANGHANGNGDANGNGHANGNGQANGSGHANGNGHGVRISCGEHASEVIAANARLAPRQRMALALRDLEGRPDDEIAVALGTEPPAVPALVARARLRLREELALPATAAACAAHLADLSAYTDGTLPSGRRAPLEAHLEHCAGCRAALFALREATQRYRAVPVPVPPGELSARMAAALGSVGLAERRVTGAPTVEAEPAPPPVPETPVVAEPAAPVASPVLAPPPVVVESPAAVAPPEAASAPVIAALPAESPAAEVPEALPAPAAAASRGGRRTAMAIAMAALVLIGIVVTLLARDDGRAKQAARSTAPAAPANPPATTPSSPIPSVLAVAAGGRARPQPSKVRHSRSGTRVFPHRSIPVRHAPKRGVAGAVSARRTARVRVPFKPPPAKTASSEPQPLAAPEAKGKIPVIILPPASRPSTVTPASAAQPASDQSSSSDQTSPSTT